MEKRDNAERRPSPDALLREAQQVEQSRLKIFFGAAPGVGKTYEMLTTARAKKAEGTDVVAGITTRQRAKAKHEFVGNRVTKHARTWKT
jgi:two-component system sensor histidine kinase KdpD